MDYQNQLTFPSTEGNNNSAHADSTLPQSSTVPIIFAQYRPRKSDISEAMLRAALENDPAGTMRYINHEIRSSAFIQQRLVQLDAAMNRHENTLQQFQKAFEKAENVDLTTYSVINQGPLLLPCRNILDAILVAQGRLQYARNMFDDRKEICRPDDLGGVEMLPWGLNYGVGIGTGVVEPAIKKCKDFDSAEVHELKMAFDLDAQQAEEVHTYNSGDDLSIDTYMEMDLDGPSASPPYSPPSPSTVQTVGNRFGFGYGAS